MLLRRLVLTGLAAATALVQDALADDGDNPTGQSTFVAHDDSVAFALTVPNHAQDLYFGIRMANRLSWAGIGLGSNDMPGALFFLIYRNERGDNVTFSPRLSSRHAEPVHFPELEYDVLNGTRVDDDYTYFFARCTAHCRSWPGGYIDVSGRHQPAVYAGGPTRGFRSDSPSADLKFHSRSGAFELDMGRTQGSADPPVLNAESATSGAEELFHHSYQAYWITVVHAIFMVFAFVLLFPQGVLMLRIFGWVKWHAMNQAASSVCVLVGLVLGIVGSHVYRRSWDFTHPHQILGIIISAVVICQLVIGFLHHKKHAVNHGPSKYGLAHVWIGRVMMFAGIINAFVGFRFALDRRYAGILGGILVFVLIGCGVLLFIRARVQKKGLNRTNQPLHTFGSLRHTYHAPQGSPNPDLNQHELSASPAISPRPVFEADSNPIHMPASPWRSPTAKDDELGDDYGQATRPREFN